MKRIKDPVYGYIELEDEVCSGYIDTAEFQRLRRIVQTGYAALYPAAVHNRFIHSLGVYHLGRLASISLNPCVEKMFETDEETLTHWKQSVETFEVACLLHDFGHSPFSHAGEEFYSSSFGSLDEELVRVVGDDLFAYDARDMLAKSSGAAPHEVMSAILALEKFGDKILNKDLFARAITGYRYSACRSAVEQLDNILIELLNSDTIDVDKLDYLIRDSFVVGYESILIDYKRLLGSLRIVETNRSTYRVAYSKSALSVLENVVYARDFEKKWIQAHPIILYDQFLVQHAIRRVNERFDSSTSNKLLTKESLTRNGVSSSAGQHIGLIADDDIIFLAKNNYRDGLIDEYFSRIDRRRPLWKSEAEYQAYFHGNTGDSDAVAELERVVGNLEKNLNGKGRDAVLSEETIDHLGRELEDVDVDDPKEARRGRDIQTELNLLTELKKFSDSKQLPFDYVLVSKKSFSSGFKNGSLEKTKILFEESGGDSFPFGEVSGCLKSEGRTNVLFYLYHRDAGRKDFPKKELIHCLKEVFK